MDGRILVILYWYISGTTSRGCPGGETNLIFDICQTDVEIINGSSSGYLRVHVQASVLDCNCTLSTVAPDHLTMGVYTKDYFPHSLNVFAGAVNKIALNAGYIGSGVGSGFVNQTKPWQLNLKRNQHIRYSSQTNRNETVCLGYNIHKGDLSIHCKATFLLGPGVSTAALRKVTMVLLISVPVLLVLLLLVIILTYIFYRKGSNRAEYDLTSKTKATEGPDSRPRKLTTLNTANTDSPVSPDVCTGHVTDFNCDSFDESDFPLPPPEAYT